MEKDLYLPSHPTKATADFFSSINLPPDWLIFLRRLDNPQIFAPFDTEGKLITFVCEHKCGHALVASRQLALYLCSGQHQRQALGLTGHLYGATIVNALLKVYVSKWEEDGTVVCAIPLFTFLSA